MHRIGVIGVFGNIKQEWGYKVPGGKEIENPHNEY